MCTSHGEKADGNMIETGDTNELNGLYATDEFRLYCYKVLPCSKRTVRGRNLRVNLQVASSERCAF